MAEIVKRPGLMARIMRRHRFGFEFKYADAPTVTKSLQVAWSDLKLRQVFLVHPGKKSYALNEWAQALSVEDLRRQVKKIA